MSNLWIDVTTSFKWRRAPVGIVRVEIELIKYALKLNSVTVKFCIFDKNRNTFLELTHDEARHIAHRIENSHNENANSHNENAKMQPHQDVSIREKIKKRILKTKNSINKRLPSFSILANKIEKRLKKSRNSILKRLPVWARRALESPALESPTDIIISNNFGAVSSLSRLALTGGAIFDKNDRYLSSGLDWDDKNVELLYFIKEERKLVVSLFCYDLIPVNFPHLTVGDTRGIYGKYFSNVAWVSDNVICISESTRKDLTRLISDLGTPSPKLIINTLGCDIIENDSGETNSLSKALEGKRFLLFVSTIERRKNHEVLYRAYARLISEGHTDLPLLIFVGMLGWGVSNFLDDLKFDHRVHEYIKIFSDVGDQELAWLYKNCLFTLYPSLYEGWGLPVVESLAHGKFCIASRESSVPEAGRNFCLYLDPWNVAAWQEAILDYSSNSSKLHERETHISQNFKPIPWEESMCNLIGHIMKD